MDNTKCDLVGGINNWVSIFKSYIDEYSVSEDMLELYRLKVKAINEADNWIVKGQKHRKPIYMVISQTIQRKEKELEDKEKANLQDMNYGVQIAMIEKHFSIAIDRKKTTVREFFDRKKLMELEIEAQLKANTDGRK